MAKGDTKTNQYLDIAANGTRADLPTDTCCETRSQTLIREVAERIMDVEDEVEELKNNPDVVDIVATYADLQAYDAQYLTDKDIIRVLQDETHDGESTYYRYNKQSDTWTYVGESKQYEDFVGTDGTTAGEAGLVPAPATTDAGKFLKADGTWDTVQAGPTVVQTTGTSQADVMSQNAVTSMVFADPAAKTKVQIGGSARGTASISIGSSPDASPNYSVAIGSIATASTGATCSIALGAGSEAAYQGQMDISTKRLGNNGYSGSQYRLLTGLYDGQSAHDAATYGQVISYSTINGAGAPTTATEGKYIGQLYYDTTNESMYFLKTIDTTTTPATYTWEALGGGSSVNVVQTTGTSQTDVMSQNAVTSMVFADPSIRDAVRIGNTKTVYAGSVGIGRISGSGSTGASGSSSIAIGSDVSADTRGAVSIGKEASIRGIASGAIALGACSKATSAGEMNIGSTNTSYGYNSSNYRLLTGLYNPQSAHDAATKGYCDNAIINGGTTAPTTATVGAVGTQYTYVDTTGTPTAHLCVCTEIDTTDPSTPVYTWQTLI